MLLTSHKTFKPNVFYFTWVTCNNYSARTTTMLNKKLVFTKIYHVTVT